MNHWLPIPASSVGFPYFNAYINSDNGLVLGWVARPVDTGYGAGWSGNGGWGQTSGTTPVGPYLVFFFDQNSLSGLVMTTRGSAQHALWAVQGVVDDQNFTEGILGTWLPGLTVQILKHYAIQQSRGW